MSALESGSGGWTTDQSEPVDYAVFGAVIYLVLGVGTFLYRLLIEFVVGEDGGLYFAMGEDELLRASVSAFTTVDAGSGFIIAIGLGAFYYYLVNTDDTHVAAFIAAAVGTAITLVVFFVLALLFNGDSVSANPDVLGLIISALVAGVVAAAVPLGLDRAADI